MSHMEIIYIGLTLVLFLAVLLIVLVRLWSGTATATQHDLETMETKIMATLQQLKDAIASEAAEVKARVDALESEVKALKDQIANGGTVTEAQLDEVLTSVQNIFTPAA